MHYTEHNGSCIYVDEPYQEGPYTKEYIESLLKRLDNGPKQIVLTGVHFDDECWVLLLMTAKLKSRILLANWIEGHYHDTGMYLAVLCCSIA